MPAKLINGATIHYVEKGRGPALILVHGFPLDGRMWAGQLDTLSLKHRVVVPDLRGFGQSPPAGPFTMESLADDIHALATELGAIPLVLAGLSMGGYVALAYARKYADTLRGLILLDTKAQPDTAEAREQRGKMIHLVRELGAVAIGDSMQPKLLSPDTIRNRPQIVKKLREMTDQNPPITIEYALAAMRDRPDQSDLLPALKIPTQIIVGEVDGITPPAVAEAMQRAIPGSSLSIIRGAGHMSPMEQPEQVNAAVAQFLSLPFPG